LIPPIGRVAGSGPRQALAFQGRSCVRCKYWPPAPLQPAASPSPRGSAMRHTFLPWAVAVALGCWLAPSSPPQESATATIALTLPDDATLMFDDHATRQTGPTRTFNTPPLPPGRDFTYDLRVSVVRDGRTVSRTARVIVQAGQTTDVDLRGVDMSA